MRESPCVLEVVQHENHACMNIARLHHEHFEFHSHILSSISAGMRVLTLQQLTRLYMCAPCLVQTRMLSKACKTQTQRAEIPQVAPRTGSCRPITPLPGLKPTERESMHAASQTVQCNHSWLFKKIDSRNFASSNLGLFSIKPCFDGRKSGLVVCCVLFRLQLLLFCCHLGRLGFGLC